MGYVCSPPIYKDGTVMADDLGISLSLEEKEIRTLFDLATRAGDNEQRRLQWGPLQEARRAGAVKMKKAIIMNVYIRDSQATASCLLRDLQNAVWVTKLGGHTHAPIIGADARCDLLFGTELCQRSGENGCPHTLRLLVREEDNLTPPGRRGIRALRKQAGRQPEP
jgi:hypothetical protein